MIVKVGIISNPGIISSIKDTNNIIVLKNGQIIQEGNHEQLITQKGYYKELYNKQIIEKESIE